MHRPLQSGDAYGQTGKRREVFLLLLGRTVEASSPFVVL